MSDEDSDCPEFVYGPKDGALVPSMLWVLELIELQETRKDVTLIHKYLINKDTKNYEYAGYYTEGRD